MQRYVLYAIISVCLLLVFFSPRAHAQFFNDQAFMNKAEERLFGDGRAYIPVADSVDVPSGDVLNAEHGLGLRPKEPLIRPKITYSDSIRTDSKLVKRVMEVQGLGTFTRSVVPLGYYSRSTLEKQFKSTWNNNDPRLREWSARESSGITDLDFALPTGGAFSRFVGGDTRLIIDGSQRITFSGKSEWTEGQVETSATKNTSFPSLTMKQEPRFQIRGQVGPRISVDIQQDPGSMGPFSNLEENISIKYQGEERDIIQYVEAGNTSLTLEGATFAGYSGTHKGLFGIRAEGQLGPLKLTTIASQEKSEANMQSYRGSAEETSTQIRDYEYKANTYFFIDYTYREKFANGMSFDQIVYNPADSLAVIEVYADDGITNNNTSEGTLALPGVATPVSMDDGSRNDDAGVEGYYHRLDPATDYYVDRALGYIQFSRRVPDEWAVGVYLRTKDGREYGSLEYDPDATGDQIELKLIKAKQQRPTDQDTWDLEWKNVYDLGMRDIQPEGLEIRVKKEATDGTDRDTQNGVPYIQILGLDKRDEAGNPTPDNKIDLNRGFVNFARGELIFPLLEPFNADAPVSGVSTVINEQDRIPEIYDSQNRDTQAEASKFYIEVETANRQSVIQVGGITGIMEGTEEVLLNGTALTRGTDYRIDYMSGRITLLNEEAMSSTADLVIRWEDTNMMQEMQKTLLGVRAEYELLSDSRLGAVMLFKNESTPDRRVKLGQEPSRTMLFDTDAEFNFESQGVTGILDKLPGLVADTPSKFRVETEFARSMPEMNTRGEVYVDDFEGSQNIPISILRSNWTPASQPAHADTLTRGDLLWYNPWNRVPSKDIWPNKETAAGENTVHVLRMDYEKPQGVNVLPDEAFGGVQNAFYGAGLDMSRSRFIEIWARGSQGELKIDLGEISEDFFNKEAPHSSFGDGVLNTEDKNLPGLSQGDGVLTKDEDTGLDGMFDSEEQNYYNSGAADPSGDNFKYDSASKNDYSHINGTEGNASDGDRLGIPDTEDINDNGILDTRNAYYEYSLDLSDPFDSYLVEDSVPEGDQYGWRLFRIPLWNNEEAAARGVSAPDSTLIKNIRLWLTGEDKANIEIASMEIVESTWLEQGVFDSGNEDITGQTLDRLRITTANTHENSDYNPPPGVQGEIDRQTKIRKKEQSLVIEVEELSPGNSGFVYRNFETMNFTDYTSLKMWVHGPDDFPVDTTGETDVELVMRIGGDRENYYEYRTPVYSGWSRESAVEIDFAQCTALKLDPRYEEYATNPDSLAAVADTLGSKIYTIRGQPSLDNVKVISVGIRNNGDDVLRNSSILINELRMDTVRDMTGSAARVNVTADLGGFVNITARTQFKDDDFHDMNAESGSGSDNTDTSYSISANLDRLTPRRWGLQLPVSYTQSDNQSLPRLKSGSDIILSSEADRMREATTRESRKVHLTYRKTANRDPSGFSGHMINWMFEKFSADFDWGEQYSKSPALPQNDSNTMQVRATYDVNPQGRTAKLFNWLPVLPIGLYEDFAGSDVAFTPSELNYEYSYNLRNQYRTNIDAVSDTTTTETFDQTVTFGYDPFNSLQYDFVLTSTHDADLGMEVGYSEENRISYTAPELLHLAHNYNYSATYNEENNPKYSQSLEEGSRKVNMRKNLKINGTFSWEQFIVDFSGKQKPPETRQPRKQPEEDDSWQDAVDEENGGSESENGGETPGESADGETAADPGGEDAEEEEEEEGPPARMEYMLAIADAMSPIVLDYTKNETNNLSGLKGRQEFGARFGLDPLEEPETETVVSRGNSTAIQESFSGRTRFSFPYDLDISTSASLDKRETVTTSAPTRSEELTFPEVDVELGNVESKLPLIGGHISNCTFRTSYARSNTLNWQNNAKTSDVGGWELSPSINARLFGDVQTSFSLNLSGDENIDTSSQTSRTTFTNATGTTTTLRYRLSSSQGLPLFRKLNLSGDINMQLTFTTQNTEKKQRIADKDMTTISKNDMWSMTPSAEYSFSQKFKGGLRMDFKNTKDMRNKVHIVREVSIWGELQF